MKTILLSSSRLRIEDGGRILEIESDGDTIAKLQRLAKEQNQLVLPFPRDLNSEQAMTVERVEDIARQTVPEHVRNELVIPPETIGVQNMKIERETQSRLKLVEGGVIIVVEGDVRVIEELIAQAKRGKISFPLPGMPKTPGSHEDLDPNKNKYPEYQGGGTQFMPESPDVIRRNQAAEQPLPLPTMNFENEPEDDDAEDPLPLPRM